jgi:flagellar protein FlbD
VIVLTRPNGQPVLLNSDLIESAEENDDASGTIVMLTTGNAVVVREQLEEIERRIVAFKRKIDARRHPES